MEYDALYHRLFSHPLLVEQLVSDFLPEAMAAGLDFSRMEKLPARFHDQQTGRRRDGDVIWRIALAGGGEVYLHLLLEFQSAIDGWMAVRTQIYQGLLWQSLIQSRHLSAGRRLPPVLSVVLYNGTAPWTASERVEDLIDLPPDSSLWSWQPRVRYHLLDMGRFPADELVRQETLTALLFRLEQPQDPQPLLALIDEVIGWFRLHPDYASLKMLFANLVGQAMTNAGVEQPLPGDLQEMRTMLATLGQEWQRKWLEEGLAKGRAQGRSEGQAATLLRQLERRFGSLSETVRQQVRSATPQELDGWADAILEAGSLDEVLHSTKQ